MILPSLLNDKRSSPPRMEKKLVIAVITMALQARRLEGELVPHSDRGSQYASLEYQDVFSDPTPLIFL